MDLLLAKLSVHPYPFPMPITKSATKRARQNPVRRDRRKPYKTAMKTMVRKVHEAVKEGKKEEALKLLPLAYKAIDTAMKKHLIHRNTAARAKAQVAKAVAAK